MNKFVLTAMFVLSTGSFASAAQAQQKPVSLGGKCAVALGASYNPARGGWYTRPEQGAQWKHCVSVNGKGYQMPR